MDFLAEAARIEAEMISVRRAIHMRPELAYHEFETARLVSRKLEELGIEVSTGISGTGVIGTLRGRNKGRVVALRADMDALPVEEASDVTFSSEAKGVMHACGHDAHVAMLLGAARLLAGGRDILRGSVKLIFQPAEEDLSKGGALGMIENGVMENPKVDFVFALHVTASLPSNIFGVRSGPIMASADAFRIRIVGKGGHGSSPHETVDPIYIAGHLLLALQGISARMIDPVAPFVISIGIISAGTKDNIIPDTAILQGTLRTLDEKTRRIAKSRVTNVVKGVCRSFGAKAEVDFNEDAYPVTVNDRNVTEQAMRVLRELRGTRLKWIEPTLATEDFSRFLQKAPGMFYFLGTRNAGKGCIYPNHSSRFRVDEGVLKIGAASLAALAFEFTSPRPSTAK